MFGLDLLIKRREAEPDANDQKELDEALARLEQIDLSDEDAWEKLRAESRRLRELAEKRPDWGVSERVLRALP